MLQIRPQEPFPIVYLLSDPGDTGTYYVRTVLRNSANGAIVKINGANYLNLTVDANNSRRFYGLIQAPTDPSGDGFWIDAVTTVYTDSGYTTVASNYAEQLDRHLVAERWSMSLSGGGVTGQKPEPVDYERFGSILKEHLVKPEPATPVDLSEVTEALGEILAWARNFKIPEAEKLALEPHFEKAIATLTQAIKAIPQTDLAPVLEKIDNLPVPHKPNDVYELVKPNLDRMEKGILEKLTDVKKIHDDFPVVSVRARVSNQEGISEDQPSRAKRLIGKS